MIECRMQVTNSYTTCLIHLAALHKISFDMAYFLLYFFMAGVFVYIPFFFI